MPTKKKDATATTSATSATSATSGADAYSVHVSMRLHIATRDRLDALVPVFARDAARCPTGRADRSDVIRAALEAGLQALERRSRAE